MKSRELQAQNQRIEHPLLKEKKVTLFIKREDVLHPNLPGNKFRKLKYNLLEATKLGHDLLLTFGGAFSNHIAAVASAGKELGFGTVGVIRGEELAANFRGSHTLVFAQEHGMRLKFVSRADYKRKDESGFQKHLATEFGRFYQLPEGGTNTLAIKGCEEILLPSDSNFDTVCCPVGTGGTIAGIVNSSNSEQLVIGFSALKGDFLKEDIRNFVLKENWEIRTDYHFGGFAKVSSELVEFINDFKKRSKIQLDPIYTGKMVFGIFDLIKKDKFEPGSHILAIHTGGLQGIAGINGLLKRKNEPLITI